MKKEGIVGATTSKTGSNFLGEMRGRGVRNLPYPEYIKEGRKEDDSIVVGNKHICP